VNKNGKWTLRSGPTPRKALPPLSQPAWSLLVQGVDLHVPAARELLERFRFVPDARLDDVMVSYASEGGGVGPHFDSYDVFLLQTHGKRRWRIGRMRDATLLPDVPLKLLQNFEPEEEHVLEPGDMLYLPPRWAHDGVADGGECLTCSIGFRAPREIDFMREVLQRAVDALEPPELDKLYTDAGLEATAAPGAIPTGLQSFAMQSIARLLADPREIEMAIGEVLSEPKPNTWFEPDDDADVSQGARLSPRTRMLYDERHVFINGESLAAGGKDKRLMRSLSDTRVLDARGVAQLSDGARELLDDWARAGWVTALS
jgi:50S ribosomal protein L16 3-hydroxylase